MRYRLDAARRWMPRNLGAPGPGLKAMSNAKAPLAGRLRFSSEALLPQSSGFEGLLPFAVDDRAGPRPLIAPVGPVTAVEIVIALVPPKLIVSGKAKQNVRATRRE
jgi:hypothetical protein